VSPRIVDKQRKREHILRSAMGVFANRGIFNFRMIEIAPAAEVGKGTLYEYFRSKQELIAGCLDLFVDDLKCKMQSRLNPTDHPSRQIRNLVRITFEYFADHPQRRDLIFDMWAYNFRSNPDNHNQNQWLLSFLVIHQEAAGIFRSGMKDRTFRIIDADLAPTMILAMRDGIPFQSAMGKIRIDAFKMPAEVVGIYLKGIEI